MEGIDRTAYKNILKQDGYSPLFAVTVGYADAANDWAHPAVLPKSRFEMKEIIESF